MGGRSLNTGMITDSGQVSEMILGRQTVAEHPPHTHTLKGRLQTFQKLHTEPGGWRVSGGGGEL